MTPTPRSIAMIHTVAGLIPTFDALLKAELPAWQGFNMVDESLLRATIRDGHPSPLTARRLAALIASATDAGAEAVVVTCSSLGPAVDACRPFCPVPLFRIDEGMAIAAVQSAVRNLGRIGVLATLPSTLAPTGALIRATAARLGLDCTVTDRLAEGAFHKLASGDTATHDAMVAAQIRTLAAVSDTVILAQASMARALATVAHDLGGTPVLTSPELGIRHIRDHLAAS